MKKAKLESPDELRAEYKRSDFGKLTRGKYASSIRKATNVVIIDPQVANAFPNDEAVNNALLSLLKIARSSTKTKTTVPKRSKTTHTS